MQHQAAARVTAALTASVALLTGCSGGNAATIAALAGNALAVQAALTPVCAAPPGAEEAADDGGGEQIGGPPVGRATGWGVRPHVAAVGKIVEKEFDFPGGIGGYRRGGNGDHPKGLALDLMTSRLGGGASRLGDRVAAYGMRNRDRFNLSYIIWDMRIASRSSGWKWKPYTRYGRNPGNTLGHRDHNHWSFMPRVNGITVQPAKVTPSTAGDNHPARVRPQTEEGLLAGARVARKAMAAAGWPVTEHVTGIAVAAA